MLRIEVIDMSSNSVVDVQHIADSADANKSQYDNGNKFDRLFFPNFYLDRTAEESEQKSRDA